MMANNGDGTAINDGNESPQIQEIQLQTSYVFIKILGHGAFGEAVLYRKTEDNSLVVWKEVALRGLSEKEVNEALNEVEILSMLNHANIISYYNHFLDTDTMFIEMEYANGGTLHSRIFNQKDPFEEQLVVWYVYQLVCAVAYIHDFGVLHRDIKTMNIFSTKTDLIKLGDFGISKVLENSAEMAETFVGTPYYMSPELVKGDRYNHKSDIWALGCVLYELLTLSKPFYATNALKLANVIVSVDSDDISSVYSAKLRELSKLMLCKEADSRPSADEILKHPCFTDRRGEMEEKIWQLNSPVRRARVSAASMSDSIPVVTSKTSEVYQWGGGRKTPYKWEMFTGEKAPLQVSTGKEHFAVVTVEKELYTWAAGQGSMSGQLGHGDLAGYKAPRRVAHLSGVSEVSCGDDFTIARTDDGQLHSFGSDYDGCLGVGHRHDDPSLLPVTISCFHGNPVKQVSCGDRHVIVLTHTGQVYTWGSGEYGCLGLGSEDDFDTPQKVKLRGKHHIARVQAGCDGSFLVSTSGRVWACGSNQHNKLGFNSSAAGVRKKQAKVSYDIQVKKSFSIVKSLSPYHITHISAGATHSAAIDLYGFLYTFGCNKYGQLGMGDCRRRLGVGRVRGELTSQRVCQVACGQGFSVAATGDRHIYAWGSTENGRLGMLIDDARQGACPSPRPIFGSLHAVPDLSSRHWYTLIIAEKVLNVKTVQVRLSSPKSAQRESSPDSVFISDPLVNPITQVKGQGHATQGYHGDLVDVGHRDPSTKSMGESDTPDWLRNEIANAEYIAVPQPSPLGNGDNVLDIPSLGNVDNTGNVSSLGITSNAQEICDEIASLHERIQTLDRDNMILLTKNEQLETLVRTHEATILELHTKLESKVS